MNILGQIHSGMTSEEDISDQDQVTLSSLGFRAVWHILQKIEIFSSLFLPHLSIDVRWKTFYLVA